MLAENFPHCEFFWRFHARRQFSTTGSRPPGRSVSPLSRPIRLRGREPILGACKLFEHLEAAAAAAKRRHRLPRCVVYVCVTPPLASMAVAKTT